MISFEQVGPALPQKVVEIPYQKAVVNNGIISGAIPILNIQYGNVWTNYDAATFQRLSVKAGDTINVKIFKANEQIHQGSLIFGNTFSDVAEGSPVAYLNSLLNLSFAINMGNFAEVYKVGSGPEWRVEVSKNH